MHAKIGNHGKIPEPIRIDKRYEFSKETIYYDNKEVKLSHTDFGVSFSSSEPKQYPVILQIGEYPVAGLMVNQQTNNVENAYFIPQATPGSERNRKLLIAALHAAPDLPFRQLFIDQLKVKPEELADGEQLYRRYEAMAAMRANTEEQDLSEFNWGRMSDPKRHYPGRFMYVVHALTAPDNIYDGMSSTQMFVDLNMAVKKEVRLTDTNYRNPIDYPESFIERSHISCSVIGTGKVRLWGGNGVALILDVPRENIRDAAGHDLGTVSDAAQGYRSWIPSPQMVLMSTGISEVTNNMFKTNEIAISGINSESGTRIRITGVIIETDEFTERPLRPDFAQRAQAFAYRMDIPVIKIPHIQ